MMFSKQVVSLEFNEEEVLAVLEALGSLSAFLQDSLVVEIFTN